MKKLVSLAIVGLSLAAGVARADHLILPVNVITNLPSCGGTVETDRTRTGQINVVFRKVQQCSNFDIVSKGFGILDIDYKAKKIPQDSAGTRTGSFTIPQVYIDRGLNAIRLEVRSNSGAHEDLIDLVFVAGPTPVQPHPVPSHSLRGYCNDVDYSNFRSAKSFAYSAAGLNYSDSQATQWALEYNRTHRCYTIDEYRARFVELKSYGYSASFLNLSDSAARDFALRHVETTTVHQVQQWKATFQAVQPFFYGAGFLNMSSSAAADRADQWVRRGNCGDAARVAYLKSEFQRHYQFAYSPSGLNLSSSQAAAYAVSKVSYLTPCSDLFR